MNSNFRLYYEKDPSFYMTMIREEDPAPETYEFKLRLYKNQEYQPKEGDPIMVFAQDD